MIRVQDNADIDRHLLVCSHESRLINFHDEASFTMGSIPVRSINYTFNLARREYNTGICNELLIMTNL
jgi:hypothetical protein